jgi:hypothetical protein
MMPIITRNITAEQISIDAVGQSSFVPHTAGLKQARGHAEQVA